MCGDDSRLYVTEIGRQPWLVHGVLTVRDALGPVAGGKVLSTLIVYLGIYAFLTFAFIATLFYMAGKPVPALNATRKNRQWWARNE